MVYDAALIALAGVRLAVKNRVIIRIVRDGADYDDRFYESAIIEELVDIADERSRDAHRLEDAILEASTRFGRGEHPSDYRAIDVETMRRRASTSRALATRLREIAADGGAVRELLSAVRLDALDEITSHHLHHTAVLRRSPLTKTERDQALLELRSDLNRLCTLHSPGDRSGR